MKYTNWLVFLNVLAFAYLVCRYQSPARYEFLKDNYVVFFFIQTWDMLQKGIINSLILLPHFYHSFCRLDLSRDNTLSLAANHLQKLHLSFQLTTPLGHHFKPHQVLRLTLMTCLVMLFFGFIWWKDNWLQVFFNLRHETNVEHIFVMESSARQFKIVLVKFLSPWILLHTLFFILWWQLIDVKQLSSIRLCFHS